MQIDENQRTQWTLWYVPLKYFARQDQSLNKMLLRATSLQKEGKTSKPETLLREDGPSVLGSVIVSQGSKINLLSRNGKLEPIAYRSQ